MRHRFHLSLLLAALLSLGAVSCSPTDRNEGTAEDGSQETVVDPANNGNDPDASGEDTLGSPDATQDDGTTSGDDANVGSDSETPSEQETPNEDPAEGSSEAPDTNNGDVVNEEGGVGNPLEDDIFVEPDNGANDTPVDAGDDLPTDATGDDVPPSTDTETNTETNESDTNEGDIDGPASSDPGN